MKDHGTQTNERVQLTMSELLSAAARSLVGYLEAVLPALSKNWWTEAVVQVLSYHQQRRLEENGIKSLEALDLAALLRVFDQNWYQLSAGNNLNSEARHFVKELQSVRNRWAHAGVRGILDEDAYRDLDTIQRFMSVINADEELIQEAREAKRSLMNKNLIPVSPDAPRPVDQPQESADETEFAIGDVVCLKSDQNMFGAVILVTRAKPENRYTVLLSGQRQTFYASQLLRQQEDDQSLQNLSLPAFHAYLSALLIQHPGMSTLYSLNAARIDFIPYQFRPVLKFIRSDRPRLLIADSVGVGKTIEAGLILRELQARRDIRSVLVICPRPLVTERKWQIEMRRFEERFTHLDGRTLRFCINEMDLEGVWPEQHQRTILPYSLFDEFLLYGTSPGSKRKRMKGLLDLDPAPRFDLVIVDEAHHVRNTETYSHKAVRFFCDNAEAVVFLTATPIQLGSDDLYVILNLLRPDLIIDRGSYNHMADPNPHINRAVDLVRSQETEWSSKAIESVEKAANTAWGQAILCHNPKFAFARSQLAKGEISPKERVELIADLEDLHTFSGIINRTRRRDIGDFTVRKPETVLVEFTPAQKKLHDAILNVQAEIFTQLHGDTSINFMMTTIRRQAASCLYGLAPLLLDILTRRIDELAWDEASDGRDTPAPESVKAIESQIEDVLEQATSLDPYDPKLEALRAILRDKQNLANNKVMVFSSFRHTLKYLYDHLKADGVRVGLVHGGTPDEERVELRQRFQLERDKTNSLDVLLFSEVGCEGLDYQFCDCIVNYDLPWNPMRVEQRIGRIDRNGQKSDTVAIFNLITPGTVDAEIYMRCLLRIGVFNSALGGGEEILGEISKEIQNIAENFALSEQERNEKLEQLADNKIRLIREQEDLEEKQVQLFGIKLPAEKFKKEVDEASSYWLSPSAIQNLVSHYLQATLGKDQEFILGEKSLKTLRLSQEARTRLLQDLHALPRYSSVAYREWENWLKAGNSHLNITFETECASQHPEAAFIMPLHPLARQAARACNLDGGVFTSLTVEDHVIPQGSYPFAIYQWQFHGIREDLELCPVSARETITERLSHLLERGKPCQPDEQCLPDANVLEDLDTRHYELWAKAREQHQRRTREIAEYRRESLATSHKARLSLLQEQLSQATDDKIRRMRTSQIASAEADYSRRIQELNIALERADVTAQPVAFGTLIVKGM